MKQYIDKDAVVAEIDRLQEATMDKNQNFLSSYHEGIFDGLSMLENFLDTLEVKEINNVWHDTRRTIPEDGSEQIICIKEDGLAVSTVGKIVNGTIKWAYLSDLLYTNSFKVEAKEADTENHINCKVGWYDGTFLDYTQEQLSTLLDKIGANVGDEVKIYITK
jgi:hypothetical protein